MTQGSFFYNVLDIGNRKTCSKQKLFRINSKTKGQQKNLYVTNDLEPGVIIFINFLLLKIEKHAMSKSCSELTLKLK